MTTEPEFPPPVISEWLRRGAVNTDHLIRELREWAEYWESETPGLPDDLKALEGLLPDDEIRALWNIRLQKEAHPLIIIPAADLGVDIDVTVPIDSPGVPPCTAARSGGIHSPARYFLQEDKTVDGQCRCGQLLKNVKCPHRHQRLNKRTKAVECEWCGGIIIAGTGVGEPVMDVSLLASVDIHRFEGDIV